MENGNGSGDSRFVLSEDQARAAIAKMATQQFHIVAGASYCRIIAESTVVRELNPASVIIPPSTLLKWAAALVNSPLLAISDVPMVGTDDLTKPRGGGRFGG